MVSHRRPVFRSTSTGRGPSETNTSVPSGRDLFGVGDEHAIGVAGGARDRQVEDRTAEIGHGDQVAVVGGVNGLLGDRVLEKLAAGEDPVDRQGGLGFLIPDPLSRIRLVDLTVLPPGEFDRDRRAGRAARTWGGTEPDDPARPRSGAGRRESGGGQRRSRGSPRAPWSLSSTSDAPAPLRGSTTRARRITRFALGSNQRLRPRLFQAGSGWSRVGLRAWHRHRQAGSPAARVKRPEPNLRASLARLARIEIDRRRLTISLASRNSAADQAFEIRRRGTVGRRPARDDTRRQRSTGNRHKKRPPEGISGGLVGFLRHARLDRDRFEPTSTIRGRPTGCPASPLLPRG